MPRFLKVRGIPTNPVGHPSGIPARYCGLRSKADDTGYEPFVEVVRDEHHIRKAHKKGHIEILAEATGDTAADAFPIVKEQ